MRKDVSCRGNEKSQEDVDVIFQPIVNKYPHDAMVSFKRGEADERRRKLELALRNYADAQETFTMRQWKQKARLAAERVRKSLLLPDSMHLSTATKVPSRSFLSILFSSS